MPSVNEKTVNFFCFLFHVKHFSSFFALFKFLLSRIIVLKYSCVDIILFF